MTFLLDANVLVYSAVPGERRDACLALLDAIARGHAAGHATAAVMEEVCSSSSQSGSRASTA